MRAALETPGRELLPDLNAAFVLESDRPEWNFLKGERLWIGRHERPAFAARFSQFRIRNGESSIISVIERVEMFDTSGAVATFGCFFDATDAAILPANLRPRDSRWGVPAGRISTVLHSEDAAAVTGTVVWQARVPADTTLIFPFNIILGPNSDVHFVNLTANTTTAINVYGYERALETYEGAE